MVKFSAENWEIDNIETVLFDKDGTFIDLHYFWGKMTELRAEAIIKRYGLGKDALDKICLSLGYDVNAQEMLADGITALYSRSKIIEIFGADLKKIFGLDISTDELANIFDEVSETFYKDINSYTKPIVAAVEFIKALYAKGVKLGVVTSDSVVSTNLTLEYFGWKEMFGAILGRESSPDTKESGALTKLALEKLSANPETTVMIGDAPMDFYAAKNAGVNKTILVASGQICLKNLQEISDFSVKTLSEIQITQ